MPHKPFKEIIDLKNVLRDLFAAFAIFALKISAMSGSRGRKHAAATVAALLAIPCLCGDVVRVDDLWVIVRPHGQGYQKEPAQRAYKLAFLGPEGRYFLIALAV